MFRQRLLTTLVLIPLVIAAIYYLDIWFFAAIVFLLMAGCALEWLPLIPIHNTFAKILFFVMLFTGCYLIHMIYIYWLFAGLITWGMILCFVYQYPKSRVVWGSPYMVGFFCLLLLPLFAQSLIMVFLSEKGKGMLVYLLCLVWAADIGAYLAGKQWGRHKLIPAVSPGKTYEGVAGGFFLAMLVALAGFFFFKPASHWHWMVIAVVVALVSLLGDLFISMLKRRASLKDTGHLLPGHGGILDRMDSLIAAALFFYCGLHYFPPGV